MIGVSSDGLLIAVSQLRGKADSERLAAIVSGITSLAMGASGNYGLGGLNKVIIDLEEGHVLVSALGAGAVLGVVASEEGEAREHRVRDDPLRQPRRCRSSPQLVMELKNTVGIAPTG